MIKPKLNEQLGTSRRKRVNYPGVFISQIHIGTIRFALTGCCGAPSTGLVFRSLRYFFLDFVIPFGGPSLRLLSFWIFFTIILKFEPIQNTQLFDGTNRY
jgi:hypothetical protein